ncbi:MFS transporter [Herbihabitans rhizosphaerae]|nr:MFS transporter [Herbihabitans rhizosphaerae]
MTRSETTERAGRKEWIGLAVLSLPTLLIAMDFTALHLAVPALSAELRPSSTQMLWIVDIYGFLVAGLLVPMGTLGDRIGRRRLLLAGATAFGAASILAAFSTSAEMLIVARALLGITGATLLPSTLALITNMFRDPIQRRLAIAVWSANFMIGGVIGPLVGGALLESFWWGAVFLAAVPVMILLLVFGRVVLPEFRSDAAGRADLGSVAMAMATVLPVVYGIKEIVNHGVSVVALLSVGVGAAAGWAFVRRQRRLSHPMLDLTLFADRGFSVSLGAQTTGLFVLSAAQFFVMQYLQLVIGLSPLRAGIWTIPAMVAGIAGTLVVPTLSRRFSAASLITVSLATGVLGLLIVSAAGTADLGLVVVGFTVLNLAINPAMTLTYDLIIGSAPPERAGTASGTAETGNELGIALGVAIAGSIGAAVYRGLVSGDSLPAAAPPEARDTLGSAVAAAGNLPSGTGAELLAVTRDAFTNGMQVTGIVLAALLAGVTIAVARLLRRPARV